MMEFMVYLYRVKLKDEWSLGMVLTSSKVKIGTYGTIWKGDINEQEGYDWNERGRR